MRNMSEAFPKITKSVYISLYLYDGDVSFSPLMKLDKNSFTTYILKRIEIDVLLSIKYIILQSSH